MKVLYSRNFLRLFEVEAANILKKKNTEDTIVIVMLNGAFIFASAVLRESKWKGRIEMLKTSSYNGNIQGNLSVLPLFDVNILKNKKVFIIEDIVDSGKTLESVGKELKGLGVKLVEVYAMLKRKKGKRPENIDILNYGIEIEDDAFVVGYGLDYDGKYRGLPYIADIGIVSNR